MADAHWVNKDKILERLRKLPGSATEAVKEQMKTEAEEMVSAMKRACPVRTGALRDSIRMEPGARPLSYKIRAGGLATTVKVRKGVRARDFEAAVEAVQDTGESIGKGDYDYARYVEFGHTEPGGVHVPAQPYFWSIYRSRKKGLIGRVKAAARRRMKAEFPEGFNDY